MRNTLQRSLILRSWKEEEELVSDASHRAKVTRREKEPDGTASGYQDIMERQGLYLRNGPRNDGPLMRSRSLGFWVVSSSISAFIAGFLGLVLPIVFFNGAMTVYHPTYATCSFSCPLILIIDPSRQIAALGYVSVAGIAAGFLVLSPLFWPKRNLVFGLVTLLGSMFILLTAVTADILILDLIPTFYLSFPLAGSLLMLGATLLLFHALPMIKKPISKN